MNEIWSEIGIASNAAEANKLGSHVDAGCNFVNDYDLVRDLRCVLCHLRYDPLSPGCKQLHPKNNKQGDSNINKIQIVLITIHKI